MALYSANDGKPVIGAVDGSRAGLLPILMLGLTILADGLDNQVFALAVPAIMKDWGVGRDAFAPAMSAGLLAAALGTMVGGWLGDRLGRRPVLIAAVMWFGAITAAIAAGTSIEALGVLRFLGGLGLGAAMPNATSLIAELAPAARRTMMITLGAACVPIGGMAGGVLAGLMLPSGAWRSLFVIGGGLGVAIAIILFLLLPESPSFRNRRGGGATAAAEAAEEELAAGRILGAERRSDTIALWLVSVSCMLSIYAILSWLPAMLGEVGYEFGFVGAAMSITNLGGLAIGLLCASAIGRLGSRAVAASMALVGGGAAMATAVLGLNGGTPEWVLLVLFALLGGCVGGLTVVLYPLAAQIYPPAIRGRGIGMSVGLGRAAAVASPLLAARILSEFGARGFFIAVAIGMAACLAGIFMIRNHVPAAARTRLA